MIINLKSDPDFGVAEWGDLLTSFNGSAITYDALGNPLIYYDGTSFTWQGRRLVGAVKGTNTMSFTYDDNGLRTSKTVNGITTEYYWNGNLLVAEKTPTYLVIYNYDASGRPIGMAYHGSDYTQYQWDVYWFDLNVFGDVVAVYDNSGTQLLTYTYDPWGYCEVGYVNGGEFTQAKRNRISYRGYYYDSDLGLYYLQSRYYDANTYRFISPDTIMSGANGSLQGLNLYAYCFNNPINMTDGQGNWPKWVENTCEFIARTAIDFANTMEIVLTKEFAEHAMNSIKNNFTATAGVGVGIGVELDIYGVSVSAIEKMDFLTIEISNGEIKAGHAGKSSLGIGVLGFSVGPQTTTFEYMDDRKPTDNYKWYDISISYGTAQYYVGGYNYSVSISLLDIFNDLSSYIERAKS